MFKSITRACAVSWVASIIVLGALFTAFFIQEKTAGYAGRQETARNVYASYRKDILRGEVDSAVKFIDYEFKRRLDAIASDSAAPMSASARKDKAEKETLRALSDLRFGRSPGGDIFVLSHYGVELLPSALGRSAQEQERLKSLSELNGENYKQFIEEARASGGSFARLSSSPGSNLQETYFARRIAAPAWIVCAAVSDSQIAKEAVESLPDMRAKLYMDIAFILSAAIVVLIGALWLSYSVSKAVKREIDLLVSYCKGQASSGKPLEESDFYFNEFKVISASLLSLVKSVNSLLSTVKEQAMRSEIGSKAKSGFIDSLRREIASPVNGIMDMVRILKDSHLDRAQRECVSAIDVSAQSLERLSAELRDFSVDDSGRLQIILRPFDLRNLVSDLVERMQPLAVERSDKLEMKLPAMSLPDLLQGDEGKIAQVLQILLANAIKFTSDGQVLVELSREGVDPQGRGSLYRFRVTDTGLGISQGKLKRIFDFTGDAPSPTSPGLGGVGLGLAVAKGLVEAMGGSIEARSEKGKGSCFSFCIPLEDERI